jgi:hypothetical protein
MDFTGIFMHMTPSKDILELRSREVVWWWMSDRTAGAVQGCGDAVPVRSVIVHISPFVESLQTLLHEGFCVASRICL